MSKLVNPSAALPVAHVALRLVMVINGLSVAAIVVLLTLMPTRRWLMSALELSPSPDTDRIILGMHAIALISIAWFVGNHVILKRLQAMVDTVRAGDPFVAPNADRLNVIAWTMVGQQMIGLIISAIERMISTPAHPIDLDAGFSVTGWLAVLLTFLLARVFAEGTRLRDDLEGTV